jgi:hypothetical protein
MPDQRVLFVPAQHPEGGGGPAFFFLPPSVAEALEQMERVWCFSLETCLSAGWQKPGGANRTSLETQDSKNVKVAFSRLTQRRGEKRGREHIMTHGQVDDGWMAYSWNNLS